VSAFGAHKADAQALGSIRLILSTSYSSVTRIGAEEAQSHFHAENNMMLCLSHNRVIVLAGRSTILALLSMCFANTG
jgi:hypothetical protein